MLSSVEQEFVWRDEKWAPLKTPACEASDGDEWRNFFSFAIFDSGIFLGRKILANIFLGGLI